ncbi:MAG: AI-2E family transporter, partial [Bacteroidetes bacterium SW_7_64_58]
MPDGPDPSSTPRERVPAADGETASTDENTPVPEGASSRRAAPQARPFSRSAEDAPTAFTLDRIVRFVLGAAAVATVGWMLWYFAGIVLYLAVGGILAYLLRPLVDRIQGLGLGRVPAILLSFAGLLAAISVTVTSVVPFITRQVQDLSQLITVDTAVYVANLIEAQIQEIAPLEQGV